MVTRLFLPSCLVHFHISEMFGMRNFSDHECAYAPLDDSPIPEKRSSRSFNGFTIRLVDCVILLLAFSVVGGLGFLAGRKSNSPKEEDFQRKSSSSDSTEGSKTNIVSINHSRNYLQGSRIQ
jgi:hypothetical protein